MVKQNFIIEFALLTTHDDKLVLNRLFDDNQLIYNKILKKYKCRIYEMEKQKDYQLIMNKLCSNKHKKDIVKQLKDKNISEEEKIKLNTELDEIKSLPELSKEEIIFLNNDLKEIKKLYGLSGSYSIYGWGNKSLGKKGNDVCPSVQYRIKDYYFNRNPYLHSSFIQNMCDNMWVAIEKRLYNKSIKLHFKDKNNRIDSICGKNNSTGICFDPITNITKIGNGKNTISIKTDVKDKKYNIDSITQPNVIKYCRIVRKKIRGKYKFYVQLTIEGIKPQKHSIGNGNVGIDVGTQTIAMVSNSDVKLHVLADGLEKL